MAFWDTINSQGKIEDRRGKSGIIGGAFGLTALAVIFLFNYLSGGTMGDMLNQLQNVQTPVLQSYSKEDFEGEDSYEVFASKVLDSTNEIWSQVFAESGLTYHEPRLVLFREFAESSCGGADAQTGPHYCSLDQTIYLDETFFDELEMKFGAEGVDVAEAYVIAHEVGHHVQNELDLLPTQASHEELIRTELQADCFAGLWARTLGLFEEGEIQGAMDAVATVGDDRIQSKVIGRIHPEFWTHSSGEQRVLAFNTGYESGLVTACDV